MTDDKVLMTMPLHQDPAPDQRLLRNCGDTLAFTLHLPHPLQGRAWLRSNLGHAQTTRKEIVRQAEADETPLHRDWYDRPMQPVDATTFRLVVPLRQVGHFEAKCYFLEDGRRTPLWPAGTNTVLNVEPAVSGAANIIYNAFVRQFGPNKDGRVGHQWSRDAVAELDGQGFAVIPPSGTFRDLIDHLDFIIDTLGCTILQLLPIHPTPTTYARMGRFGSPYAALSFLDVDPALARFDPAATPLEQFGELVDAVHARGARLFLDIAINHTGWAARMHGMHPEWLARDDGGRIEVPGAWGVQWEDLTRLDYRHKALWHFMADMFLTWCRRGVDGFRCDAGYMIPQPAWRYMVARVRQQFPDTIFLLEGLGGKLSVTRDLLNRANFNWAYSELFQSYDRRQIEAYLPGALDISASDGLTVHFAETHDNPRLAARSHTWARMRTALCALFAPQGAFGFANGVEWFATEKIDVHDANSLNWGAKTNQVDAIRRLTDLLKTHPCFHSDTHLELIQADGGNVAVLLRHHRPTDQKVLAVANLDDRASMTASWPAAAAGWPAGNVTDLLTGRSLPLGEENGLIRCSLAPGEVLCLAPQDQPAAKESDGAQRVPRVEHQRRRAKVLDLVALWHDDRCDDLDVDALADVLWQAPETLCRRLRPEGGDPGITRWAWPRDRRREVMVPPGHVLLISAPHSFQARLVRDAVVLAVENSLATRDGRHIAMMVRERTPATTKSATLEFFHYAPGQTERVRAPLKLLAAADRTRIRALWPRRTMPHTPLTWLGTNGRGAMTHIPVRWAALHSRYDALLAANLNPDVPEDRWIMLTRLRAWVVFQGFSQEIRHDCLETFQDDAGGPAMWRFRVPTGQGQSVRLEVSVQLLAGRNTVHIAFHRAPAGAVLDLLPDTLPMRLIVRPDIEDRNFHTTTKAYLGPETHFGAAVTAHPDGFDFSPDPRRQLRVRASAGAYAPEPEWHYMVHRPLEAERGLDAASDLFSPGYFTADLPGGARQIIIAEAAHGPGGSAKASAQSRAAARRKRPPMHRETAAGLERAMHQFIVKRGKFATVIAGYPWFLDWGRDTLIFCRGMIAAGMTEAATAILRQFAAFEQDGTLPNMIRGDDATNRDTSDAPLWLFTACRDLIHEGHTDILESACGRRRLGEVLVDMAGALIRGTPNGIVMDPASGLLFSPAHFTWMDTNHPAGSPRQGYPIEIQALWHAALELLADIGAPTGETAWHKLADRVRASIGRLYFDPRRGYLADCRHGRPGQAAEDCPADDALRPNQLFAVTLGAVSDPRQAAWIVEACQTLLVPGAIRSLADRPVTYPLAIHHDGRLLNDPHHPYQGRYRGDEDTQRKPAYHNGTAWTWVFPSYCEALAMIYGESGKQTGRALLATAVELMNDGCLGHIPEILDGDAPHQARGCDAQAWSVSEVYRVWRRLA